MSVDRLVTELVPAIVHDVAEVADVVLTGLHHGLVPDRDATTQRADSGVLGEALVEAGEARVTPAGSVLVPLAAVDLKESADLDVTELNHLAISNLHHIVILP